MTIETNNVVGRLREEADLCRNDGADDIAALLEEAASENQSLSDRIDVLEGLLEKSRPYVANLISLGEMHPRYPDQAALQRHKTFLERIDASLTQGGKTNG